MPARLTAYVAGSVTLAAGVISYAAFERPNFYSAAVYLSQSNACLMILCNLALVLAGSFMYTLQNFLYGPLRPAEVEQLWERGWFAVMEWIFAMSTFRDEFGIWFLCMFLSLFTGKVWGWIAEGRVEQLDQQDPGRAKLFHWKLVASLIIYLAFAVEMFLYSLDIVMFEARPGMTVMFVFEFAILWICAVSTCLRYGIWIYEHWIVQKQMKAALEARRAEIRLMHQQAAERTSAGGENSTEAANLPNENEIDEDEIDVPGWDAKKSWLFALDLTTDFLKLLAYIAFFTILTVFYGIPIYIIRDLYMTMRSFTKRITDYVRYQAATRDMHARYPDATAEDLASDGTCIVCREEMKPWGGNNAQAGAPAAPGTTINERQRPKKLPCGHILHFSCLQSWLERQQACPICRRSVFAAPPTQPGQAPVVNGQPVVPGVPGANNQIPNPNQPPARPNRNEGRVFRFRLGPLRLQFGGGRLPPAREDREVFINDLFARLRDRRIVLNPQAGAPAAAAQAPGAQPGTSPMASPTGQPANTTSVDNAVEPIHPAVRSAVSHMQLDILETQIRQEITSLNLAESRITGLRALLAELDRTRAMQRMQNTVPGLQAAALTTRGPLGLPPLPTVSRYQTPTIENGSRLINFGALPGGQTEARTLPEGMVVPPGWTLVPLNPVMAQQQPTPTIASSSAQATPPSANAASEALTAPLATSTAAASVPSPFAISSPPAGPSSSLPSSSSPAANTPTATSTTAPLVPTPTWSFPTAPDTIPVTTNSESSVAEGKKPATQTELPTTVVEPPTPVVGNESEAQGKDKQAFVEDDEE